MTISNQKIMKKDILKKIEELSPNEESCDIYKSGYSAAIYEALAILNEELGRYLIIDKVKILQRLIQRDNAYENGKS